MWCCWWCCCWCEGGEEGEEGMTWERREGEEGEGVGVGVGVALCVCVVCGCRWTSARVTLNRCVKVTGACTREVWCTSCGTGICESANCHKHSELQNLFSYIDPTPPSAQLRSVVWIAVGTPAQRWVCVCFPKEWAVTSAVRGLAVLRDHDSRRDVLNTIALFQSLRPVADRVNDSSNCPHQTDTRPEECNQS